MKALTEGREGVLLLFAALAVLCTQPLWCEPATEGSEIIIGRSFSRKPIPQWKGGYLVGFELHPVSSPPVFAYDRSGQKLFETSLALDGAHEVWVRSMAASRDGRFALSGMAISPSGVRAAFIAFLDQTGRLIRVNRLERFFARHLCFIADGTLWAAGSAGSVDNRGEEDHHVLRAYSVEGNLKLSLLPRSSFAPVSDDLALNPHPAADGKTISQLTANDKVVVFMTAGFREMIGISPDGQVLFRTRTGKPASCDFITGFAVGPDGRVLISCEARVGAASQADFAFHRFDPSSGSWTRLYSRSARERGLPKSIALIDGDQMLIKIEEDRFRWMSRLP